MITALVCPVGAMCAGKRPEATTTQSVVMTSATAALATETYDLAPDHLFPHKSEPLRKMGANICEILEAMLGLPETDTSKTLARRMVYDRDAVKVTITDTPANLARASEFIRSIDAPAASLVSYYREFSEATSRTRVISVEGEMTFKDVRLRVTRIDKNNEQDPSDDAVEMVVRTPETSEDLALTAGKSRRYGPYVIKALEVRPSLTLGEGAAQIEITGPLPAARPPKQTAASSPLGKAGVLRPVLCVPVVCCRWISRTVERHCASAWSDFREIVARLAEPLLPEYLGATPKQIVVHGTVTLEDGRPAEGAAVTINRLPMEWENPGGPRLLASAVAGPDGSYAINLPYRVGFGIEVSRPLSATAVTYMLSSRQLSSEGTLRQDFCLPDAVTITGRVVDDSGKPLPDIPVGAVALSGSRSPSRSAVRISPTTSTADGTFSFDDAIPGDVGICTLSDDFYPEKIVVSSSASDVLLRVSKPGGVIEGRVVCRETSSPLGDVIVSARPTHGEYEQSFHLRTLRAVSESDGCFRFEHLAPTTYTLALDMGSSLGLYLSSPDPGGYGGRVVAVSPDTPVHSVELVAYAGHTVSGIVTDRRTGKPLSDVEVSALGQRFPLSTRTGSDGRYSLSHVFADSPRGQVHFAARKQGWLAARDPRHPRDTPHTRLATATFEAACDIQLVPAAWVVGTIHSASGEPVAEATVTWHREGESSPEYRVSHGRFSFPIGPDAPARIMARAPGYGTAFSPEIHPISGRVTGCDLVLQPCVEIQGTVTDEDNRPIGGATVRAFRHVSIGLAQCQLPDDLTTKARADGSFRIDGAPAGAICLNARMDCPDAQRSIDTIVNAAAGKPMRGTRITIQRRPPPEVAWPEPGAASWGGHWYRASPAPRLSSNVGPALRMTMSGYIVDEDGCPFPGETVCLSGGDAPRSARTTITDAKGRYVFEHLPGGPRNIECRGRCLRARLATCYENIVLRVGTASFETVLSSIVQERVAVELTGADGIASYMIEGETNTALCVTGIPAGQYAIRVGSSINPAMVRDAIVLEKGARVKRDYRAPD